MRTQIENTALLKSGLLLTQKVFREIARRLNFDPAQSIARSADRSATHFLLVLPLVVASMLPSHASAGDATLDSLKSQYARPASIPHPADNAHSPEREELGRQLFFDPRLSSTRVISCASCHNPSLGWGDVVPKGLGIGQQVLARKSPSVLNMAWLERMPWDGRIGNLEEMSKVPVVNKKIFNTTFEAMAKFLSSVPEYKAQFTKAYPGEEIGEKTILKALAQYQRTIVSPPASFDRWLAGDEKAISDAAKRGFAVFNGKAKCAECHSGWSFTDGSFQDIGVEDADVGAGAHLKMAKMQHSFKVPTLRDVARRAPFMHNGSEPSLAAVIDFYNRGGKAQRPSVSRMVKPLGLSAKEQEDLLAFLLTLSSENKEVKLPVLPVEPVAQPVVAVEPPKGN